MNNRTMGGRHLSEEQKMEMRMLSVSASVLIPLLENKEKDAYARLLGGFRSDREANLALVATCNAYTSLREEIEGKLRMYEKFTEETNGNR